MRLIRRRDVPYPGEAAVGFGVATAARDVAISVGIVLGLLYLLPILGRIISGPGRHRDPPQAGPLAAGLRLPAGTGLGSPMISALVGPGLLIGLAAAALVIGGLLLCRCDA
jgi:ABC-2 type transport system permease protein